MVLSLTTAIQVYHENRDHIHARLSSGTDFNIPTEKDKELLGMAVGTFIIIIILLLVLYVWAIIALINNWEKLPGWAKVIGLLGVIPGVPIGPLVTLIVVFCARQSGSNFSNYASNRMSNRMPNRMSNRMSNRLVNDIPKSTFKNSPTKYQLPSSFTKFKFNSCSN